MLKQKPAPAQVSASKREDLEPILSRDFMHQVDTFCFGMLIFTGLGQPQNKTLFGRHIKGSMEETVTAMQEPSPLLAYGYDEETVKQDQQESKRAFDTFKRLRRFDESSGLFAELESEFLGAIDRITKQKGSDQLGSATLNAKRTQCLEIARKIDNIVKAATHEASELYQKMDRDLSEIKEKGRLEIAATIDYYKREIDAAKPAQKGILEKEKDQKIADVRQRLEAEKKQTHEKYQQELINAAKKKKEELDTQFDALWALKQETDPKTDENFKQDLEIKRLMGDSTIDNIYLGSSIEFHIPKNCIMEVKTDGTKLIKKESKVGYKDFIKIKKEGNSYKIKATLETREDAIEFAQWIIETFKDKGVTITMPENYEHKDLITLILTNTADENEQQFGLKNIHGGFSKGNINFKLKNDKGITEETALDHETKSTSGKVKEGKIKAAKDKAEQAKETLRIATQSALKDDESQAAKVSPVIASVEKSLETSDEQSLEHNPDLDLARGMLKLAALRIKDPNGHYKEEIALIASTPTVAFEIQTQAKIDTAADATINRYAGAGNFNIPARGSITAEQRDLTFTAYLAAIATIETIKNLPSQNINDINGIIDDIIANLTIFQNDIQTHNKGCTVDIALTKIRADLKKIKDSSASPEQKQRNVTVQLLTLQAAIEASAQSAAIDQDITAEITKSPKKRSSAIASYEKRTEELQQREQIFTDAAQQRQEQNAKATYFRFLINYLNNMVMGNYAPENLSRRIPQEREGGLLTHTKNEGNDRDLDLAIQFLTQPTSVHTLNHWVPGDFADKDTTIKSFLSIDVGRKLIRAVNDLKAALDSEYALQQKKNPPSTAPELLEAAKKTEAAKKELAQAVEMAKQDLEKKQKDLEPANLAHRERALTALKIDPPNANAEEIANLLIAADSAQPKDKKTIDYINSLFAPAAPPTPVGVLNGNDALKRQVTDELQKTKAGEQVLANNTTLAQNLRTTQENILRPYLDNFRQVLRGPSIPPLPNCPTMIDFVWLGPQNEAKRKEVILQLAELDKMLGQPIMKEKDVQHIRTVYDTALKMTPRIQGQKGHFKRPEDGSDYFLSYNGISNILAAVHQATLQDLTPPVGGGPRPQHP